MSNDELAKEITLALIREGHVKDAAYTAVSRLIKERLPSAMGPMYPRESV